MVDFLFLLGSISLGTSFILALIFVVNILRKKPYLKFFLSSAVCFFAFFVLGFSAKQVYLNSMTPEERVEYESIVAAESESKKAEDAQGEEDYKKSCKTVSYEDIARNPDEHDGSQINITGKVTQVSEGVLSNSNTYLVSVTQNEYGFWEDDIYVSYTPSENESRILEDDTVTFYGECTGVTTYVSVLGAKITIPSLSAKYVEMQQ